MTQEDKMNLPKTMSSRPNVFSECLQGIIIFTMNEPPLSSMSSYIFRGHLRWVNRINRDFNLCFPVNLTNTLVPQPRLSSILQNQQGVALDALTNP